MLFQLLNQYDVALFRMVNHWPHPPFFNLLAIFLHYATRGMLIYVSLSLVLLIQKKYQAVFFIFASMAITEVIADLILKQLIHRPRPFVEIAGTLALSPLPSSYSFPSAQTAVAFAVAMACRLIFKNKGWRYTWVWAGLVAIDRVYMGHHYPLDVLSGAFLGVTVPYLILFIKRKSTPASPRIKVSTHSEELYSK